jgi:protein prenyltransferase alpha subunit repeat containing protein 1
MADILIELEEAFSSDPSIDEIGTVVREKSSNNDPAVIVIEHKLGILHWAMKPLYTHCMQEFFRLYKEIKTGSTDLSSSVSSMVALTRGVLIVKGDMPLALAIRKELITAGLSGVSEEMKFIGLIFPRHPKASSLWQHRRWCLQTDSVVKTLPDDECALQIELNLCSYLSDIYPKNYYAWTHRLWLLQFMDEEKVSFFSFFD